MKYTTNKSIERGCLEPWTLLYPALSTHVQDSDSPISITNQCNQVGLSSRGYRLFSEHLSILLQEWSCKHCSHLFTLHSVFCCSHFTVQLTMGNSVEAVYYRVKVGHGVLWWVLRIHRTLCAICPMWLLPVLAEIPDQRLIDVEVVLDPTTPHHTPTPPETTRCYSSE